MRELFEELQKPPVVGGIVLLTLGGMALISYRIGGQQGIGIWESIVGTVLTSFLVGLYAYQASIQREQLDIMNYQKRVNEQNFEPDLEMKSTGVENGHLKCKIRNEGMGIAVNPGLIFQPEGSKVDNQPISFAEKISLQQRETPYIIHEGEVVECRIQPRLKIQNSTGDEEIIGFSEYVDRVKELGKEKSLYIRIYAENLADEPKTQRFRREVVVSEENHPGIEDLHEKMKDRYR